MEVKFYETVEDVLLKFAVVVSKSNGKWVLCKHRNRDTYEIPGGHREENETILQTAKRGMGCFIMQILEALKMNCTVK